MAGNSYSLVVIFKDEKGEEDTFAIPEFNFNGKMSTLVERVPSIVRDVGNKKIRGNLKLKALWWGENAWLLDTNFEVTEEFKDCLLIMVDTHLQTQGIVQWSNLAENIIMSFGKIPKKYDTSKGHGDKNAQNKSKLVPILLFILGIIIAIVSNVASNILPLALQPYYWLSWPLLAILTIISIFLLFKQ